MKKSCAKYWRNWHQIVRIANANFRSKFDLFYPCSISPTFLWAHLCQYSCIEKVQTYNLSTKKLHKKNFRSKMSCVKFWWNWHQNSYCFSTFAIIFGSQRRLLYTHRFDCTVITTLQQWLCYNCGWLCLNFISCY